MRGEVQAPARFVPVGWLPFNELVHFNGPAPEYKKYHIERVSEINIEY